MPKDSKIVAKIVLFDKENKVLFLKRSNYIKKFAGKWDLPGGHIHEGEDLIEGLKREVKEETNLDLDSVEKVKKEGNKHYFKALLPSGKIKISSEHSEYKMRNVKKLKNPSKFEKVAQEAIKTDSENKK